jgi:hypothetical protein
MPGALYMPQTTASGIPGPAAAPAARSAASPSTGSFLVWLAIFGVVIPVVILGGLNAGRFRFVYVGK